MSKYFEVTVEVVVATLKNGKDKKNKDICLVDAMSVTEAEADRKSTRLNSSHNQKSRMPSSA